VDKARLYQEGRIGPRVYASAIGEEPWWRRQKVPLVCAFCVAPVVSQRASVGRVSRPALFRLATDRQHETVCPLNPREVLERIARGARGIAHVRGDELHLVLPGDLQQIDDSVPPDVADPHVGEPVGVDVSTVRPLLPPLINSAVAIARFLQKHGDPDVAARFKVRRPGEREAVGWGEFCYGPAPGDHGRLYALLADGRRPAHPVAVFGRIRSIGKDSLERPVVRLGDGTGFSVRIRSEHPSLLDPLTAGDYVLVVGTWKIWTPQRGRQQTELQAFVDHHWQLSHWSYDDTTGHHSPPACPPPLSLAQRALRQARTTASPTRHPGRPARTRPRSGGTPRPQTSAAPKPAPIPSPQPPATTSVPQPAPPTPPPPPVTPPTPAPAPPVPDPPAYPPAPSLPSSEPPRQRTSRKWWPFGRS